MNHLSFQPVTLDSDSDKQAMLVFREDKLLAVLTCLGPIHEELEGRWFVEAMFDAERIAPSSTFEALAGFEGWVGG